MSDRMTPIPFEQLMDWILNEKEKSNTIFGVHKGFIKESSKNITLFGENLEEPFGPAAGPHTQLAQNIIAAYYAGSRFFELKTVQTLDGEDLPVSKPCINAVDEGYNVEWSTELTVPDAFREYVKAWFAIKLISKEFGLGNENGFIFNMSVGYDLEGIKSPKIDQFIEGLKNAEETDIWYECKAYIKNHLDKFEHITKKFIYNLKPVICNSITLSTLHGCPPGEIERIATYLIKEKHLNTYIKCNPTLLGYDFARKTLDDMGYDYITFDEHHFKNDLQFEDAVPMIHRLLDLAKKEKLSFGVKLTNTFPVQIMEHELPGEEMYMSGRALYPLTVALCLRLSKAFEGKLPISYSGGADVFNIKNLFELGIRPITLATTILKPGGYNRIHQIATELEGTRWRAEENIDIQGLEQLANESLKDPHHIKSSKPINKWKMEKKLPLLNCFAAPCKEGCPIHQDAPLYIQLAGEGKYEEALEVILKDNPLPFITGTICNHRCMQKCTRNFYEEPIQIRDVKLKSAINGYDAILRDRKENTHHNWIQGNKTAIIGGGPAGLAAAYFLSRAGIDTTIFEKSDSLGGVVCHVIPEFRITSESLEKDIELIKAYGVHIQLNAEIKSLEKLKSEGFENIIIAVGATKPGELKLEAGNSMNALEFLIACKKAEQGQSDFEPGKNVVIIGGGNTAMDAARAAKRISGVETVSVVYRRTKRYMPAAEEELELAQEEGIIFYELLSPVSLSDGLLKCCKMALGNQDETGRRKPVATTEFVDVPADLVVASVGEQVDSRIFTNNHIDITDKGYVNLNGDTLETNCEQIYVIGDAAFGPGTVVEAIRDARKVTDTIISKVNQEDSEIKLENMVDQNEHSDFLKDNIGLQKGITGLQKVNTGLEKDIADLLKVNTSLQKDNAELKEYNARLDAITKKGILIHSKHVEHESSRCLQCSTICECCVDVCPNRANIVIKSNASYQSNESSQNKNGTMPQILHIDNMCNECGNCESFCPYDSAPYREKFTLFHTLKEFEDSKNDGFLLIKPASSELQLEGKASELLLKVRIGNQVIHTDLKHKESIPVEIADLIQQIYDEYRYILPL